MHKPENIDHTSCPGEPMRNFATQFLAVTCLSFAIILILSAQNTVFPQGFGSVTGIVYDSIGGSGVPYASLRFLNAGLGTRSDREGKFEFAAVPAGGDVLECALLGYGSPRRINLEITADSAIFLVIDLSICEYDLIGSGDCPVCGRSNEAIPIVYGEPAGRTLRKAKRGKVYLGGCAVTQCDPHWYCKRDKVKY